MKRIWIVGLISLMGAITGRAYPQRGIATPGVAAQGQEQQTASGTVVGLVRNTETKQPIEGVTITLIAPNATRGTRGQVSGGATTTTDNAGRFTFSNVAPATYSLRAEREGFFGAPTAAQPSGATGSNQSVTVSSTQLPTNVVFELLPGGSIRGRVYEPDGRLSPVAQVSALLETYQDGHIVLSASGRGTALTDDRGEFRIWGLVPGRYYLRAQSRANAGNAQGLVGYYPAELDAARAQVLRVRSDNELLADIHLSSGTFLKISGRVIGIDAGLANGIQYQLIPRDPEMWDNSGRVAPPRGRGGPASEFEIQTPLRGRYEVFAVVQGPTSGAGLQAPVLAARLPVDIVDRNIDGLTFTLRPTFDLQVRFVGNGDPQIGNQILSPINVRSRDFLPSSLSPRNATTAALAAATAGLTGEARDRAFGAAMAVSGNPADGTKFTGITEGRYFVDSGLQSLRDAYVADIRQGGKSLYEDGTIVIGTEQPAPVEIVLARSAGTIQGAVQDSMNNPVPSAQVVLVPDGRRRENFLLYKKATTSADGKFSLGSLAPGQYKVFAWENLPAGAERNPQFMARFEQLGRPVVVTAGSTISNIVVSVSRDRE